jgi:hypothetical protein
MEVSGAALAQIGLDGAGRRTAAAGGMACGGEKLARTGEFMTTRRGR